MGSYRWNLNVYSLLNVMAIPREGESYGFNNTCIFCCCVGCYSNTSLFTPVETEGLARESCCCAWLRRPSPCCKNKDEGIVHSISKDLGLVRETVCMISTGHALSSEGKDAIVREELVLDATGLPVV